jgi:hypothetical protein
MFRTQVNCQRAAQGLVWFHNHVTDMEQIDVRCLQEIFRTA